MYKPAKDGFPSYFIAMLADADRNDQYDKAIEACIVDFKVKTGSTDGPVVLDLGCGTGLLTQYALKHGARHAIVRSCIASLSNK